MGLTDSNGNALTLTVSEDGIYQAGSYYDYLKSVVENSLNNFLADTSFPYRADSGGKGGLGGGFGDFPDGELPDGDFDFKGGRGEEGGRVDFKFDGQLDGNLPDTNGDFGNDYSAIDGVDRLENTGGVSLPGTYETAQDYIDALNAETEWVAYDSETNTAAITSIADFVCALKLASKSVGAFDDLNETQVENILFGDGDGEGDHFDAVMAELLADSEYGEAFAEDLARTDALGNSVEYRVNMYNPMYYLSSYYEGNGTSNVAAYWRIRSGITQGDTALTTEVNLALALESQGANVDFETVWGQGHVEAERTGSSRENFIEWVIECCK